MAKVKITRALNGFFNVGDGKRPVREFAGELRAMSDAEKLELARGVVAITGDTLDLTPAPSNGGSGI